MKRPAKKTPTAGIDDGPICANEMYRLQQFLQRLKIGRKSWRSMKNAGLRSCKIGRQVYILGQDALDFFQRLAEEQATGGNNDD